MAQTTVEPVACLPATVVEFAKEHGVEQFLYPHLEITKRLFPSALRVEVVLEDDPEIADLEFIVFRVDVACMEVAQAAQAQDQWVRESLRCCSPAVGCPFVLGLNLAS